jgi:2-amino-4-hydroxy-6-hydroxymethyldihydropteridine diphosphokinase
MTPLSRIIVSLGSNISPVENLRRALERLQARETVLQVATAWETPAVGTIGPNFYNSAVRLLSEKDPTDLKQSVLRPIEQELGRVRTSDKYAPRPIDLDPVLWGDDVLDDRLWEYAYLAVPIAELCPDLINSRTGERLADIASRVQRATQVIAHPELFDNPGLR